MRLGFNEANDRFCQGHTVMQDLELCEKYDLADVYAFAEN